MRWLIMSNLIGIYTICKSVNDFEQYTLLTAMDMAK